MMDATVPLRSGGPGPGRQSRVPIFMYHRLTARPEEHPYSLVAGSFRTHLALLRALGYRSVSALDVARAVRTATPLPSRRIAITFDDGYTDTLTVALPLLLEYGFTASCYIVAGRVGGTSDWTDPASLMGWPEIRAWLAAGMEVGSHTLSHRDLTCLPAPELMTEVQASKARLEDRLGCDVTSFAYPFNRVGRRELESVEAAGYEAGCAGPELSDSVLALTRVEGASDSLTRFLLRLLPAYPRLRHVYRTIMRRRHHEIVEPNLEAGGPTRRARVGPPAHGPPSPA